MIWKGWKNKFATGGLLQMYCIIVYGSLKIRLLEWIMFLPRITVLLSSWASSTCTLPWVSWWRGPWYRWGRGWREPDQPQPGSTGPAQTHGQLSATCRSQGVQPLHKHMAGYQPPAKARERPEMGAGSFGPSRSLNFSFAFRVPALLYEIVFAFLFCVPMRLQFTYKASSGVQLPVKLRYNGGGEVSLVPNAATWGCY